MKDYKKTGVFVGKRSPQTFSLGWANRSLKGERKQSTAARKFEE